MSEFKIGDVLAKIGCATKAKVLGINWTWYEVQYVEDPPWETSVLDKIVATRDYVLVERDGEEDEELENIA